MAEEVRDGAAKESKQKSCCLKGTNVAESSCLEGQVRGGGEEGGAGRQEDFEGECMEAGEAKGSTNTEEGEEDAGVVALRRSICTTKRGLGFSSYN